METEGTIYCLGLPLKEQRELGAHERQILDGLLAKTRRVHLWTKWLSWGLPFFFLLTLMAMASLTEDGAVIAMLPCFLLLAILWLVARDRRERFLLLRASSKETQGQVFEANSNEEAPELLRLPITGLLLMQDGKVLPKLLVVPTTTVSGRPAPIPSQTNFPKQLAGIAIGPEGATQRFEMRRLTQPEVAEMRRLLRNPELKPDWRRGLGTLYLFAIGITGITAYGNSLGTVRAILGFGLSCVGGSCLYLVFRRRIAFLRDIKKGYVLRTEQTEGTLEFLPLSRLVWSSNDDPAPMRTVGGPVSSF